MKTAAQRTRRILPLLVAVIAMSASLPAQGQTGKLELPDGPTFGIPGVGNLVGGGPQGNEIELSAALITPDFQPGGEAILTVTAVLPESYYIYSTKKEFSGATRIQVVEATGLEQVDEEFRADHEPKVEFHKELGKNGEHVEKFYRAVTWFRRYRIAEKTNDRDTKLGDLSAIVKFSGNYCGGQGGRAECIPISPPRVMLAEGESKAYPAEIRSLLETVQVLPYFTEVIPTRKLGGKETPDPIEVKATLSPEGAQSGDRVKLTVTMNVTDPDFHTFALDQNPKHAGKPTVLDFARLRNLKAVGSFEPDHPPKVEQTFDGKDQRVYYGKVTWVREYQVTDEAPGGYGVDGAVKYQICTHGSCRPTLTVPIKMGSQPDTAHKGPALAKLDLKALEIKVDAEEDPATGSLGMYLLYAFIGGMILNVMPCVLPVIAIKVLSFVQQAGESRSRIFLLNMSYSIGVIAVFMILATLAVGLGLGWGGLFQKPEFNLVMACLVFAMGLSLLGVFELPVPGLVGSAAGQHHQEGLAGAFLTGIFATLLATPCSGPFLGATLAWSVLQPKEITYLVWFVMGFGMAFPYLVFGMFPAAIKWLPKPGNWMIRFKEISGFVLMGSVVFIISFLNDRYTIPALIMIMGVAIGLWMIGNLYDFNSKGRTKVAIRVAALVITGLICGFGYRMTQDDEGSHRLDWQDFSEAKLSDVIGNKTVLIDFTADWCLTCKANERFALNRPRTKELVKEHGIVTLYADYTDQSPEIKKWLDTFKSISVPLTVIFPANQPDRPILLRDLYTEAALLKSLERAATLESRPDTKLTKRDTDQASLRIAIDRK